MVLIISLSCYALLHKTTTMHLMRHPGPRKPVAMTLPSRISEKMQEYKNATMVLIRSRQDGYSSIMMKMNTIREVLIALVEADAHYFVLTAARPMRKGWTQSCALRFLLEGYLVIPSPTSIPTRRYLEMSFVTSLARIIF